ncbi:MAG: SDR family oxidoreductase [Ilumatobacteraceae bacterium]
MNTFDLGGATALVTGAGQGVGRAIALTFADNGAGTVLVNDVDPQRAAAVAAEVDERGATGVPAVADVTDLEAVQRIVELGDEHGGIDILVNNAGNMGANPRRARGDFWAAGTDYWDSYVGVNFYGPMNCVYAVLPQMIERGSRGRLITIISDAGRVGEPGLAVYSAAKAGAAGFTRAIARAVSRHGITANNVAIAATRTPATAAGFSDDERMKKVLSRYVVRRVGEPEDVAAVVLLLASPASSWVTGQTYPVNGGYSFNL